VRAFLARNATQACILGILLATLAVFVAANPRTFLAAPIYLAFLSTIPFTAIIALGMTLVIIAGQIDLSFPSVMALSGLVFATILPATGSGALALVAALACGGLMGLGNGLLVAGIGVPAIIATLGADFFWRGLTMLASDGLARSLVAFRDSPVHALLVGRLFGVIPAQALWLAGIAALVWLLYHRHVFGDALRFVGDNPEAAAMTGVPVRRTKTLAFVLLGLLAAFSSCLVCMEMGTWWPTQGEGYLLLVFASVFAGGTSVFGGEGTVFGTLIGAVLIGIIEAGVVSSGFSGFWTRLIYGLVVLGSVSVYAVLLRSRRR